MADITFRSDLDVQLVKTNASDLDVARSAWVSTMGQDARGHDSERLQGLINYLVREGHHSPLEHNSFTFFIDSPIFVNREFMRHRTWSFNETSGRYRELDPVFYVVPDDRKLVQTGKAGAYTFTEGTYDQLLRTQGAIKRISSEAWSQYQALLDKGIAKEVARMVLPVNIYSPFYATANLRNILKFLTLRTINEVAHFKSTPQFEIEQVANKIESFVADIVPMVYKAWNENGRLA